MEKILVQYCNGSYSYTLNGEAFTYATYSDCRRSLWNRQMDISKIETCPEIPGPNGKVTRRCCQSKYKDIV